MGNALQDALLKAGLVSEKEYQSNSKPKWKKRSRPKKVKAKKPQPVFSSKDETDINAIAERINKKQAEKIAADKKITNKKNEQLAKQELRVATKDLLHANKLNKENADVAYYFKMQKQIKHVYVTEEQQQKLMNKELAIAVLGEGNYLIDLPAHEKLKAMNAPVFLLL